MRCGFLKITLNLLIDFFNRIPFVLDGLAQTQNSYCKGDISKITHQIKIYICTDKFCLTNDYVLFLIGKISIAYLFQDNIGSEYAFICNFPKPGYQFICRVDTKIVDILLI